MVTSATTLKAVASAAGMADSAVASAAYTFAPSVTAPLFGPSAGTFVSSQNVHIATATSDATIRYTIDGSTPSRTAGTVYASPVTVSATTTIRAIAYADGMIDSTVSSATYTIVAPPVITALSPSSGAPGGQVAITGTGFGSTPGKVWLGSTHAAVLSWSDTQILATVALNATSGSAQVQQGAVMSEAVPFEVIGITVTGVSPGRTAPGAQVIITGTRFAASQGAGQVWLGTAYGTVVSWSDTQIVATVAAESVSGKAQVLQDGVWSTPAPLPGGSPAHRQHHSQLRRRRHGRRHHRQRFR